MKASVLVNSTPMGRQPNEIMDLDLLGTVQREGYIDYGFEGMMGHHHNVVGYFRDAAEEGKLTLFSV